MPDTIQSLIRSQIDQGERDTDVITKNVVSDIIAAGDADLYLSGLVRPQVSTVLRAFVRAGEEKWHQAERASSAAGGKGRRSPEIYSKLLLARRENLKNMFFAPGFGEISWAEATEEHHEAARKHSMGLAAAHQADADRHGLAIRQIREAGVTCLAEIPGYTDEAWFADAAL